MPDQPWHPGELSPAALERARRTLGVTGRPRMPYVGDGVTTTINMLDSYASLVAVSFARVEYLGALLAEQTEAAQVAADLAADDAETGPAGSAVGLGGPSNTAGLIGYTYSATMVGMGGDQRIERVPVAEEVRALVALEAQERDRCAKLIKDAMQIGLSLQQIEVIRSYAGTISAALQTMVTEIGLSLDDSAVLRAAQRAGLAARRAMGQDDGDPDLHVGPRMTPGERVSVLRAALEQAEAELEPA